MTLAGFLGRLTRLMPGRRRRELARTEHALGEARASARLWRAKGARQKAKIARLRRRVASLQHAQHRIEARYAGRLRHVLSPIVLEEILPLRLHALRTSSRRAAAVKRAAAFASRSAAYREAVAADTSRIEGAEGPYTALGLHWWIPCQRANDSKPDLAARVAAGDLPLKGILARRELAVGAVMLDIGANVGTTSIPRVALGDFGCIYAAEPEPLNYATLVHNILANGLEGFVLPDRVALGAADGEVEFAILPRIGSHRIATADDRDPSQDTPRIVVPSRTLDSWIASLGIDPRSISFVQCDVQGWEPRVLEGAAATLRERHIVWEIEVSPKHLREAGSSLAELCELVRRHFDRFIDLRGEGPRSRPVAELEASLEYLQARRRYTDILVYNVT